jgi:hypothetical protein
MKLGVLDAGYSRAYIGIRSTIHPSKRGTNKGKTLSTNTPEKLVM